MTQNTPTADPAGTGLAGVLIFDDQGRALVRVRETDGGKLLGTWLVPAAALKAEGPDGLDRIDQALNHFQAHTCYLTVSAGRKIGQGHYVFSLRRVDRGPART